MRANTFATHLANARLVSALRITPTALLDTFKSRDSSAGRHQAAQRRQPQIERAAASGRLVAIGYLRGPAEALTYVRGRVVSSATGRCILRSSPELGGRVHVVSAASIVAMRAL